MALISTNSGVLRLAVAQALAGANTAVVYATAAVIGHSLAPDSSLSTLPITIFVLGMALSTIPVGVIVSRYGRRVAFLVGNVCGVIDGLLAGLAIMNRSFALFCIAMVFGGMYAAIVLTFRFAAAECVPTSERATALSTVMAGGVVAGILGPQLVTISMGMLPTSTFAATYFASAGAAILSACVLVGISFSSGQKASQGQMQDAKSSHRSTSQLIKQPKLIGAMVCGAVVYMLMNFLMTSAPLAMDMCGIPQASANLGIQWHIIGMYGPSFMTGALITRLGAKKVVLVGLGLMLASILVGLTGQTERHFLSLLILLGLGWNFGFLGASALVLECHRPEEKSQVQSTNDFFIFGMMVLGSFLSGGLLSKFGWEIVCAATLIPLTVAAGSMLLSATKKHQIEAS